MPKVRYWVGEPPEVCDMCQVPIENLFYDCAVPSFRGSWANICRKCFVAENCRIGIGYGQQYERTHDNKWACTGGNES